MKLNKMIFSTGTKFVANNDTKNKRYPPGTLGFISSTDNLAASSPNITLIDTIIVRRGKKGKLRVERNYFSTPIFDVDRYKEKQKHAEYDFIHIEKARIEYLDVMEAHPLSFLGWGLANANFLFKLCKSNIVYNAWPSGNNHPMNSIRRIGESFTNDPDRTLEVFGHEDFRNEYIISMRKMQSKLLRPLVMNKAIQSYRIVLAISYLIWLNESKGIKGYDKKLAYDIYHLSRERATRNKRAVIEMDKRRIEENKRKGRPKAPRFNDVENNLPKTIEYNLLISRLKKFTKNVEQNGLRELNSLRRYVFL